MKNKFIKKIVSVLTCFLTLFLISACSSNIPSNLNNGKTDSTTTMTTSLSESVIIDMFNLTETTENLETNNKEKNMVKPKVEISILDYGKIQLELEPEIAPITVENFLSLVKSGFYDGITFHRIINGFMMQGGDPEGTGAGGSKNTIKGEFDINGVKNPISHVRGVISMARRGNDNNSASSQFFIVHEDSTFLDGQYAAFGRVISGLDVVDKVCENAKVIDRNGSVAEGYKPVIEYIKVID